MDEITDPQKEILTFIQRTTEERGFPPTIREIGEEMDIRSTNGVNDHLKALERVLWMTRQNRGRESLRLVEFALREMRLRPLQGVGEFHLRAAGRRVLRRGNHPQSVQGDTPESSR